MGKDLRRMVYNSRPMESSTGKLEVGYAMPPARREEKTTDELVRGFAGYMGRWFKGYVFGMPVRIRHYCSDAKRTFKEYKRN
jgi:hypothetical protein